MHLRIVTSKMVTWLLIEGVKLARVFCADKNTVSVAYCISVLHVFCFVLCVFTGLSRTTLQISNGPDRHLVFLRFIVFKYVCSGCLLPPFDRGERVKSFAKIHLAIIVSLNILVTSKLAELFYLVRVGDPLQEMPLNLCALLEKYQKVPKMLWNCLPPSLIILFSNL